MPSDLTIPSWLLPILGSALCLGVYDICKKHAVKENAVMPVLFLTTLSGTLFFILFKFVCELCRAGSGAFAAFAAFAACTPRTFFLILLKSCIVSGSWSCVYAGLRDMPVSIVAPIRSTTPLWCILGGVLFLGELPTLWQSVGMAFILAGGFFLTLIGQRENISWHSKGILLTVLGTILGAASGVYDKYLMGRAMLPPQTVQFYFMVDLVLILGIALIIRNLCGKKHHFLWRWSIPMTGILLIFSDMMLFYACSLPDSQISILSLLRRSSVVIVVLAGGMLFREKALKLKLTALGMILAGVAIIALAVVK